MDQYNQIRILPLSIRRCLFSFSLAFPFSKNQHKNRKDKRSVQWSDDDKEMHNIRTYIHKRKRERERRKMSQMMSAVDFVLSLYGFFSSFYSIDFFSNVDNNNNNNKNLMIMINLTSFLVFLIFRHLSSVINSKISFLCWVLIKKNQTMIKTDAKNCCCFLFFFFFFRAHREKKEVYVIESKREQWELFFYF